MHQIKVIKKITLVEITIGTVRYRKCRIFILSCEYTKEYVMVLMLQMAVTKVNILLQN